MVINLNRKLKFYLIFWLVFALIFAFLIYLVASKNANYVKTSANSDSTAVTIIVDAGHGGEDGGATADDGTLEKDINLSISLKLRDMLSAAGFNVVMTRETDEAIYSSEAKTTRQRKVSDIRNRMKLIEETDNAIFLSVHQNHFGSPKYYGTQVFYSKNNPDSETLAKNIQQTVVSLVQPENTRAVKKTGTEIYLLYHAQVPAVMVECGFLSNAAETAKLKTDEYQSQMAFSILCGVLSYFGTAQNDVSTTEVT